MKVIIVDDMQADCAVVQEALAKVFGGLTDTVEVGWYQPNNRYWDAQAEKLKELSPDVVLMDEYMPQPGDGVELLRALRRIEFPGFTYLWTTSDRAHIDRLIEQDALLLDGIGTGGFCSRTEAAMLADKIKRDFEACGQMFVVPNPGEMVFDPLDVALNILVDLLPLCFSSDNRDEIINRTRKAIGCDSTDPTFSRSFRRRVVTIFRNKAGLIAAPSVRVRDAANALSECDSSELIDKIADLRDALLEVCQICYQP
jgi:CheY-like chemotaxis protein